MTRWVTVQEPDGWSVVRTDELDMDLRTASELAADGLRAVASMPFIPPEAGIWPFPPAPTPAAPTPAAPAPTVKPALPGTALKSSNWGQGCLGQRVPPKS